MPGANLTIVEREELSRALVEDPTMAWAVIARRVDRHPTTVARDVMHNGGRTAYRAASAGARSARQRRRPKVRRLVAEPEVRATVTADLPAGFSPAGIAARLGRAGGPRVCSETIYQAVYGRRLDVKARDCLRARRPRRRRRNRAKTTKSHVLGEFRSIHLRPPTVAARVEVGNWEGDLIIGARNASALITLVERATRFTLLADLPEGYDADAVLAGLVETFDRVPARLRRSLTWDRRSEMARGPIREATCGLPVFFADAHAPWPRGLNEHTNRLLRWWLPKGTELAGINPAAQARILGVLNHQPRRSLGWDTPAERYAAATVR